MFHCWKCGAPLAQVPLPLSRYAQCPACESDLYVCRQCVHYDSRYSNACREERAEPPRESNRANFCDWFEANPEVRGGGDADAAARRELEALFGGGAEQASTGTNPLDALFKK